ncbi:MAG: hypothetical protein AB7S61_09690 [Methanoregulaceae archaeon]
MVLFRVPPIRSEHFEAQVCTSLDDVIAAVSRSYPTVLIRPTWRSGSFANWRRRWGDGGDGNKEEDLRLCPSASGRI